MAVLYAQTLAHRFGVALIDGLENGGWNQFDFAVAWVRRSGIKHLDSALRAFLRSGNAVRGIVGVDLENTSYEGLKALLDICAQGDGEIYIHHNEANVTFHPKLYLLSNRDRASLIVGSNNLTASGLYTNTEVCLQIESGISDQLVLDALAALKCWRDVNSGFARRLDATLLQDLLTEGYILREDSLARRTDEIRRSARPTGQSRRRFFGSKRIVAPPTHGGTQAPIGGARGREPRRIPGGGNASSVGNVLLIRVRRASETERRTQIQLPIRKMQRYFGSDFFEGATAIVSVTTGEEHALRYARARGTLNTIKVEVPEIDTLADPVLRLERTPEGISYEAFDSDSPSGRHIMNSLRAGLSSGKTIATIRDHARATMARFI